MAKKKTKMGRPRKALKTRVFGVRGTGPWLEWVKGFAESQRAKPQELVDRGLALLAKDLDYLDPPPRI